MARRTTVTLTDDIDGSDAIETVSFGLDGRAYEIDLNAKNAKALRSAVEKYATVARRAGVVPRQRKTSLGHSDIDPAVVRAWALAEGYEVSARGRVAASLVQAYKDAH